MASHGIIGHDLLIVIPRQSVKEPYKYHAQYYTQSTVGCFPLCSIHVYDCLNEGVALDHGQFLRRKAILIRCTGVEQNTLEISRLRTGRKIRPVTSIAKSQERTEALLLEGLLNIFQDYRPPHDA